MNFVRALKASKRDYYIVGTDFNKYHLVYPDVDSAIPHPSAQRPEVHPAGLLSIVREEKIDFLHPQPSSEALVISANRSKVPCRVFLPSSG